MVLKLKTIAALMVAVGCAAAAGSPGRVAAPAEWVEREAYLMGTGLRVGVEVAERERGLEVTERVFAEVRRLEGVLSSWRADSEVGRLNAAPVGEPFRVTPELWALLEEAREWTERSGGAFDPAVGPLVDAWDLRGAGRRPTAEERAAALAASGLSRFRFDAGERTVTRLAAGAWLDTGGFGKGVALRAAERLLREAGVRSALLDFGGQLVAVGEAPAGGAWEVGVAHPSRRSEPVLRLWLRDASSSTSSQSERYVAAAGERLGHVLDPRSGEPVPAWGSVTVVAADAAVADMVSTAVLVMGPERGIAWAAGLAEVGVLVLEERDGAVVPRWNPALERYRVNFNR